MKRLFIILGVIVIALWFLTPIFFIIVASLTTTSDYYNPKVIIPSRFTFEHLYKLFFTLGGLKATLTSVQVAAISIGISFLIGLPAGYAFTRYIFPGKNAIRLILLLTRSIPLIVIAVPLVILYLKLNLADSMMG
ncbi:MAG: carbohydrate ABC transporter permease, partial [Thermotogaceae bacterium]|nr:carbohydrate ABC transporter permease [Thermotogaceae bacterium]